MRFLFLLTFTLAIINPTFCRTNVNFPDLLVTNQYLLVHQYGCMTQFEAGIEGMCPQSSKKPKDELYYCKEKLVHIHLIRDPNGINAPKLAVLMFSPSGVYMKIEKINGSSIWKDNNENAYYTEQHKEETSHTFRFSSHRYTYQLSSSVQQTLYTLYDPTTQSIFILDYMLGGKQINYEQFFVSKLFEQESPRITSLIRSQNVQLRIHKNNEARTGWTQDPYKNTVYYKESNGELTTIYEISTSRLFAVLFEGVAGRPIVTTDKSLDNLSVAGGIRYGRSVILNGEENTVVTTYRPQNTTLTSSGIQCSHDDKINYIQPIFTPFLVIRDDDYCLIRYGRDGLKECREKREAWLLSKGLIYEQEDPIKWLVITIIILVMILVLLLVYVYWLRSTFVAEDDHTRNDYEANEASLFVAKQRSFPSVYPDPALLDVSVDKWN